MKASFLAAATFRWRPAISGGKVLLKRGSRARYSRSCATQARSRGSVGIVNSGEYVGDAGHARLA